MSELAETKAAYHCTTLAASELLEKSGDLGNGFTELRDAYHTDHLDETIRLCNGRRDSLGNSDLKRLYQKYITYRPSRECRTMLKAFLGAEITHKSFRSVWKAHKITDDLETTITRLFDIRHNTGNLENPDVVIEGRKAFEIITRATDTGVMLSFLDMVDLSGRQEREAANRAEQEEQADYKRMYEAVLAKNRQLNAQFTALKDTL